MKKKNMATQKRLSMNYSGAAVAEAAAANEMMGGGIAMNPMGESPLYSDNQKENPLYVQN